MQEQVNKLLVRLNSLTIFRGLLKVEIIQKWVELLNIACEQEPNINQFVDCYSEYFHMLMKHCVDCRYYQGLSLEIFLTNAILFGENPVSKMVEKESNGQLPDWLYQALKSDLNILCEMAAISSQQVKSVFHQNPSRDMAELIKNLPEWDNHGLEHKVFSPGKPWGDCAQALVDFYRRNGSGLFARYKGFIWERRGTYGRLRGLIDTDPVRLADFIGYELQRNEIIENTLQFINGYPANNLLLYGDRGTGKSSTVKALLNEYHDQGLRMIELPKGLLSDFSEVLRAVRNKPQRFIVFIDDLSFDDNEDSYTALKAVLDGSLESKPENLLIYATSNRRHLVKERFSDRTGLSSDHINAEIHAADTMEEKLSLADRFGMTITFSAPDQEEYLRIVDSLVQKRGLKVEKELLHREAVRWEMLYNGRSPRTALQFVNWLEGKKGMEKEISLGGEEW